VVTASGPKRPHARFHPSLYPLLLLFFFFCALTFAFFLLSLYFYYVFSFPFMSALAIQIGFFDRHMW
jgi:hypothetical protein